MTDSDLTEEKDLLADNASTGFELEDALTLETDAEIEESLKGLHPADFSDQLEELTSEQRNDLVNRAPELISGDVLAELEDEVVEDILPLLTSTQIADAITSLDNDDATQIVEEMDKRQREIIFDALEPIDRAALEASLAFDDIVDTGFKPMGYVPVSKLMRFERNVSLESVMDELVVTIAQDLDQEEAAYLFEKYNLISAPVIDSNGRLVGMMTVDDIIEIIQDENKEDILALAGVSDAGLTDTAYSTVKSRAPWLLINLFTAVLASLVIAQFDYAITQIVALAVLMPIVASMGGNAGTQALAVAVRALTEKDLTSRTAWRAIRREALAALMIGVIFATVLAVIAFVWFRSPELAFVAFVAMIVNHIFAGVAGVSIPLLLKHYGADPAVASSVFVTTVTDIVGFFAFLGFASLMLL